MLKIISDSDYSGYIGIEYEGKTIPEMEGIRLTQSLINRTLESLEQSS